jgi:hypothetical protein
MEETQVEQSEQVYAAPIDSYGGSIVLLTNPEDDLLKLELILRGLDYNINGQLVKVSDPLVNMTGAKRILGLIKTKAHKIQVLGNVNTHIKYRTLMNIADTLIKQILVHRKEFGIKTSSDGEYIVAVCMEYLESILESAENEGNRRFWRGSMHDTTIRQEHQGGFGGFMSRLMPWRR